MLSILFGWYYQVSNISAFDSEGKEIFTPSTDEITLIDIVQNRIFLDGRLLNSSVIYLKKAEYARGILIASENQSLWAKDHGITFHSIISGISLMYELQYGSLKYEQWFQDPE